MPWSAARNMSPNGFDDLPIDEDDAALWSRNAARRGRHRLDVLLVIAAGGVIGATARYALAQAVSTPDNGFPIATLATNVMGSFLLGFLAVVSVDRLAPMRYFRPFFAVGLIGSFTTFSTFAVETVVLVDQGDAFIAAIYVPTMLFAGIAAARIGIWVARSLGRKSELE
jgi:CrcB protein